MKYLYFKGQTIEISKKFEEVKRDDFEDVCVRSLHSIDGIVTRFAEFECALEQLLELYEQSLPCCFEPHLLEQINSLIKKKIYDVIRNGSANFDEIFGCIQGLAQLAVQPQQAVELDHVFKSRAQSSAAYLSTIKPKFDAFIQAKDDLAVYSIGMFLRETLVSKLDVYLDSLVRFRVESTQAFEAFERDLNNYLIAALKDGIPQVRDRLSKANNQLKLATNNTYKKMLEKCDMAIECFNSPSSEQVFNF